VIAVDLLGDDALRKRADDGKLVPEIAVQSGEVFGQLDEGIAIGIRRRIAVIDIHHVRRFDERVREIFVFGIERVIDLE
jgi:hypothetical protein